MSSWMLITEGHLFDRPVGCQGYDRHMAQLDDRTIIITGAASGLGRALATRFAAEGAAALGLVDIDADGLADVAAVLRSDGSSVVVGAVDITDAEAMRSFVSSFTREFGRLDVMVNNAGILSQSARLHHVTTEDFRRVLDVNVIGTFHGIRAAVSVMRPAGAGTIINTASVSGLTAWSHSGPYCASKAAVIHLTKVAAVEYAEDGILVNCVCPGTFQSAIHAGVPDTVVQSIAERHPLGRLADVDEIVGAYVYLAGHTASFTTGSALVVDGGYSAP